MTTKSIWVAIQMGESGRKVMAAEIRLDQERAILVSNGQLSAVESNKTAMLGKLLAIGPNPGNLITALGLSEDMVVVLPAKE